MLQYPPMPMKLYRWSEIYKEAMKPLLTRQVLHGEKMTVARVHIEKGGTVPVHNHVNEQLTMLESGRLRFMINDEEHLLEAGDMILVPSNAPHSVEALEDCVAVDINAPAREDWIRGDDAYLRG
jgi:quercetin dioxygenase-like cupin family protein